MQTAVDVIAEAGAGSGHHAFERRVVTPNSPREVIRKLLVWFLIPVGLHAAVLILLFQFQGIVKEGQKKEAVIDTALDEIDIRDNPFEPLAPTNVQTSVMSDRKMDWKDLLKPDMTNVKGPDERSLVKVMENAPEEPTNLLKISVPTDGLAAIPRMGGGQESKGSTAAVVDALGRELAKELTKRNVLLVWLFDESGSMRQSQREIRERITKVYEELQGVGGGAAGQQKLVSAVASYGSKYTPLMKTPSADAKVVQTAIDRIPLDDTGKEMVMTGCRAVFETWGGYARIQRRALIIFIVTDEVGDDTEHLEAVIGMLRGVQPAVRVFVLGGEAVFQRAFRWVEGKSPDDGRSMSVMVDAGPESAYYELLDAQNDVTWGMRPRANSGFGFWALSRLANATGGVYYLVQGKSGPAYDPELMAAYLPELCSRDEYVRRCKANAVRQAITALHPTLQETNLPGSFKVDSLREELAKAKGVADRRIQDLTRIIAVSEKGSLANEQFAPKRWEANRELAVADCYALRWSARQYALTVEQFIRQPALKSGATGYHIGGRSGTPLGGEAAAKELAYINKLYDDYIVRYTGTPWAWSARNSRGYTITQYAMGADFPPRPQPPGPPQPKPVRAPKL